jgi:hypothetical protein
VLGLVDPRGDRPNAHEFGGVGSHQLAWIGFVGKPARVIRRREDCRHAIVNLGDELISVGGDNRERAGPLARR